MSATCQLYLLALASALAMHLFIHFLLLIQIHSCREVGVDPSCQRVRSKPCTDYQGDKQSFMLIYTYTLESLINLTSISLYCGTECTQTWEGTCKLYSWPEDSNLGSSCYEATLLASTLLFVQIIQSFLPPKKCGIQSMNVETSECEIQN